MALDPCIDCRPPKRHPGCKKECEIGQASIDYWQKQKELKDKQKAARAAEALANEFRDDQIEKLYKKMKRKKK